MGKILVEVDEIIQGTIHSTYQLILKEVNGNRRLPIIIGVAEAQSIALAIEEKTLKRPNTHDLFYALGAMFEIKMKETYIDRFQNGVFYATITMEQNDAIKVIDSRTSDGVALALRFGAPIFIDDKVLSEIGITIQKTNFDVPGRMVEDFEPPQPKTFKDELKLFSKVELEKLLAESLELEDYARAAIIRDEIAQREK